MVAATRVCVFGIAIRSAYLYRPFTTWPARVHVYGSTLLFRGVVTLPDDSAPIQQIHGTRVCVFGTQRLLEPSIYNLQLDLLEYRCSSTY